MQSLLVVFLCIVIANFVIATSSWSAPTPPAKIHGIGNTTVAMVVDMPLLLTKAAVTDAVIARWLLQPDNGNDIRVASKPCTDRRIAIDTLTILTEQF